MPILNVKLSPSSTVVAVQRRLPDEWAGASFVEFRDRVSRSLLWRIKIAIASGYTAASRAGVLFLSDDRYVLTDREVAMYARDRLMWTATVPIPEWPLPTSVFCSQPENWSFGGTGYIATDGRVLFVPAHWVRKLGRGPDGDSMWDDRYCVELISPDDGAWLQRADSADGSITQECIPVDGGRAECKLGPRVVGVLEPPSWRRITSADVSLNLRRAVVVLDGNELVELELDASGP